MAAQVKIQVLVVGEKESGKSRTGSEWFRKTLQVFTGEVAGNIPVFGTEEEVDAITQAGYYMADVVPRAGDRGRLEYVFGKLTPAKQAAAQS